MAMPVDEGDSRGNWGVVQTVFGMLLGGPPKKMPEEKPTLRNTPLEGGRFGGVKECSS